MLLNRFPQQFYWGRSRLVPPHTRLSIRPDPFGVPNCRRLQSPDTRLRPSDAKFHAESDANNDVAGTPQLRGNRWETPKLWRNICVRYVIKSERTKLQGHGRAPGLGNYCSSGGRRKAGEGRGWGPGHSFRAGGPGSREVRLLGK